MGDHIGAGLHGNHVTQHPSIVSVNVRVRASVNHLGFSIVDTVWEWVELTKGWELPQSSNFDHLVGLITVAVATSAQVVKFERWASHMIVVASCVIKGIIIIVKVS